MALANCKIHGHPWQSKGQSGRNIQLSGVRGSLIGPRQRQPLDPSRFEIPDKKAFENGRSSRITFTKIDRVQYYDLQSAIGGTG